MKLFLIIIIIAAAGIFFIFWYSKIAVPKGENFMSEQIHLKTKDGVDIMADYYQASKESAPAVILLHMMPADRLSWKVFASKLQEAGWQALAIDLRGHGGSIKQDGKILNYKKFSDAEHQASRGDVDAALEFFLKKGITKSSIAVAGASIGANLALDLLARQPEIASAVLLSPGLDYRGIVTEPMAKSLSAGQRVFIAASRGDSYAAESSEKLAELSGVPAELRIFENSSQHGTNIFKDHPELMPDIIEWLGKSLK